MNVRALSSLLLILYGTGCTSSDFSAPGESQAKSEEPKPSPDSSHSESPESSGRPPFEEGGPTETFVAQGSATRSPVDIIFVVDTSGSMLAEKARLEQNMAVFISQFVQKNAGVDYQLFLIGQGFVFPNGLSNINHAIINQGVASNNGLWVAWSFLSGALPSALKVRPDAIKEFVFVTDDNALQGLNSLNAEQFAANVASTGERPGGIRINGFVGVPGGDRSQPWCTIVRDGTEYIKLQQMPQFGGLMQNLCEPEWKNLFDNLSNRIGATGRQNEYQLVGIPEPSSIQVKVDGVAVPSSTWSYDDVKRRLTFVSAADAPPAGAKVDISYLRKP